MSQGASELPKPAERKSSWQSLDGKKTYHICITCMKKGKFKDLNETHHYYGKQEVYSQMLAYCYSLHASKAMCDKVIYICPKCITRLRAATDFRKQIENSQIKCKQLYYESFLCHEPKVDKPNLLCAMEVSAVVPSDIEDARMLSTRVKTEGVNLEDVKTESDTKNSTKRLKLNSSEEIPTDTETSPSLLTRCPVCYESFRSGPELVRHTRIHDAAIYPGGDQESRTQEDVEMETQVLKQEDMMISCDEGDIILVVQAEDEGNEEVVNNESDFEWSEEDASNSDNEVSKPERMRYPRSGGLYACPECPYTTLSGAGIHNHYLLHQQKTFLCEECGFACRNSYKLRLHQLTHSKLKPHACHECDYTSRFASDLTFHMQKHRDDRPHTCETCGKSFKRTRHLKTHQLTHEDLGKFKCERCDFVTKSALTIARHTSNHDRMLTCKYCDQVFEKRSELTTHRVTEHDHLIKRFSCADDATLQITCDICQASFGNVKKLEKHMISHSDLRPFGCDLCDMKFKRKTDVYKHRLIHSNKKPFACSKCPFASVRAADLRVHFRKHSDLRPFPCTLCPRRFKKRDTLTRHALTHSDEKPHLCTQCGFKCRTSELLKRHLRTHVGPRLGCEECDYSCLEPRQLLKHKLKHAQEKSPEAVGGAGDDGMVIEEWVLCE